MWKECGKLSIFLGLEAIDDEGLTSVNKKNNAANNNRAVEICQELDVGYSPNFIVDPDWDREELPKIILGAATLSVLDILKKLGIDKNEIKFWALHPGGRAILDSLQKGLELSNEQLQPSRKVLNNYGNMSSVSILFVLKEILYNQHLKKDDLCCAIAFGPGLTMEVILFKAE